MTDATIEATEAAEELAREHGLELEEIAGSGEGGRITKGDVQAHLENETSALDEPAPAPTKPTAEAGEMDDRDHLRGCPAARVETYQARQPRRAEDGSILEFRSVRVLHCLDCGETVVTSPGE